MGGTVGRRESIQFVYSHARKKSIDPEATHGRFNPRIERFTGHMGQTWEDMDVERKKKLI
jgi:hypothetical protein